MSVTHVYGLFYVSSWSVSLVIRRAASKLSKLQKAAVLYHFLHYANHNLLTRLSGMTIGHQDKTYDLQPTALGLIENSQARGLSEIQSVRKPILQATAKTRIGAPLLNGDRHALTSEIHLQRLHSEMAFVPPSQHHLRTEEMESNKAAVNS
jgi:hypothetical protein